MPSSPVPVPFPASLGRFFNPPMSRILEKHAPSESAAPPHIADDFDGHLNRWEDSSAQAPAKEELIEHPTWSIKIRTILLLLLLLLFVILLAFWRPLPHLDCNPPSQLKSLFFCLLSFCSLSQSYSESFKSIQL